MSIFSALKNKITIVGQDVQQSFHGFTKDTEGDSFVSGFRNIGAGADLIEHFNSQLNSVCELAQSNCQRAEDAEELLKILNITVDSQQTTLSHIQTELLQITSLMEEISNMSRSIATTKSVLQTLNEELLILNDICGEQELKRKQDEYHQKFETYERKKHNEMEDLKNKLEQEYSLEVQKLKQESLKKKMERQKQFEDAFLQDMLNYKQYGADALGCEKDRKKILSTDLNEIILEEDSSDFDQFLADSSSSKQYSENKETEET